MVEPEYGFLIPYHIKANTLFVLRIYRSMRAPLEYGELDIPE